MHSRPDVLVLGAGGVLGEAWMTGVLAGIEDATGFDLRRCEYFVGTSAGSIVAAQLAGGESPRRPSAVGAQLARSAPQQMTSLAASALETAKRAGNLAQWASAPFASFALAAAGPGGALMRAALLASLPAGRETLDDLRERIDRLGSRFDGRLRIACVDRRRGHRVVFGSPGAPNATVGQAVSASCAVPSLFTPVWIGGREYVDGGVWSVSNLDVAPAGRETHVLCLNPAGGLRGAQTLLAAARNLARSAVSVEGLVLRRRGAVVQTVAPNAESSAAMGADFMDREPRARVLSAGYAQGLALARRDL
jgi:NTE family protein